MIKLNSKGITEILLSNDVQRAVHGLAEQVATAARMNLPSDDRDIVVDDYDFQPRGRTSDRAASSVTYRSFRALDNEAKNGTLIRAAASAGLEVKAE